MENAPKTKDKTSVSDCISFSIICRTKILTVDLTSKQRQIENLTQQTKDLEYGLQCKQEELTKAQLKFAGITKLISTFQNELQTQRTTLNDIKVNVQENYQDVSEYHKKAVANVALLCKKFTEEKSALADSLMKVSASQQVRGTGRCESHVKNIRGATQQSFI